MEEGQMFDLLQTMTAQLQEHAAALKGKDRLLQEQASAVTGLQGRVKQLETLLDQVDSTKVFTGPWAGWSSPEPANTEASRWTTSPEIDFSSPVAGDMKTLDQARDAVAGLEAKLAKSREQHDEAVAAWQEDRSTHDEGMKTLIVENKGLKEELTNLRQLRDRYTDMIAELSESRQQRQLSDTTLSETRAVLEKSRQDQSVLQRTVTALSVRLRSSPPQAVAASTPQKQPQQQQVKQQSPQTQSQQQQVRTQPSPQQPVKQQHSLGRFSPRTATEAGGWFSSPKAAAVDAAGMGKVHAAEPKVKVAAAVDSAGMGTNRAGEDTTEHAAEHAAAVADAQIFLARAREAAASMPSTASHKATLREAERMFERALTEQAEASLGKALTPTNEPPVNAAAANSLSIGQWLNENGFSDFSSQIAKELGVTKIGDLAYVAAEDLAGIGITGAEQSRFLSAVAHRIYVADANESRSQAKPVDVSRGGAQVDLGPTSKSRIIKSDLKAQDATKSPSKSPSKSQGYMAAATQKLESVSQELAALQIKNSRKDALLKELGSVQNELALLKSQPNSPIRSPKS